MERSRPPAPPFEGSGEETTPGAWPGSSHTPQKSLNQSTSNRAPQQQTKSAPPEEAGRDPQPRRPTPVVPTWQGQVAAPFPSFCGQGTAQGPLKMMRRWGWREVGGGSQKTTPPPPSTGFLTTPPPLLKETLRLPKPPALSDGGRSNPPSSTTRPVPILSSRRLPPPASWPSSSPRTRPSAQARLRHGWRALIQVPCFINQSTVRKAFQ